MKARLAPHFKLCTTNEHGRCSHEFIIDCSDIRAKSGIVEEDIAKRLQDYGFHAPTMSWPVHHSLMVEPTESEDKGELDRFVDALIAIRKEIGLVQEAIENPEKAKSAGEPGSGWCKEVNPLKNAPHTQSMVLAMSKPENAAKYPYSQEEAAFPLEYIQARGKFWPTVGRVNNGHGDKNVIVTHTE
jgi:glycine dehydrogenase